MTNAEKNEILVKAKEWFKDSVGVNHIKNTKKLSRLKEFKVNPFTFIYLSNFLTGDSSARSIAKALIYPRALGTSINTTFGNNIQKFTSDVLGGYASTTSGIDIEFIDQVDGRRKYCQLKAGPNTINKDDVTTISGHFKGVKNLARTNNLQIQFNDLVVAMVYGKPSEISGHYKALTTKHDYPVLAGQEFWYRLTGDQQFYSSLVKAVGEVAIDADYSKELESIIDALAEEIDIDRMIDDI